MGLTIKGDNTAKKASPAKKTATTEVAPEQKEAAAQAAVETPENTSAYGVDSSKLIFIQPLGDPSKQDKTTIENKNGGEPRVVITSTIVGYRFKAEIDLDVPDVPLGDDARDNSMSYAGDTSKTRHVKAGEVFDLTRFETGLLMSQERFNARCTGGDKPMVCTYNKTGKKDSKGNVASVNAATAVPVISLKALTPGASIKDYPMEDVLTCVDEVVNDQKRKKRTIKAGFEKFAPLCVSRTKSSGRTSTGGAASMANQRNQNAAAFLNIVAAKQAKAAK